MVSDNNVLVLLRLNDWDGLYLNNVLVRQTHPYDMEYEYLLLEMIREGIIINTFYIFDQHHTEIKTYGYYGVNDVRHFPRSFTDKEWKKFMKEGKEDEAYSGRHRNKWF